MFLNTVAAGLDFLELKVARTGADPERMTPLAATPERYLRPEVIRQVARLDLRAKFIVEGFIAGLHSSRPQRPKTTS